MVRDHDVGGSNSLAVTIPARHFHAACIMAPNGQLELELQTYGRVLPYYSVSQNLLYTQWGIESTWAYGPAPKMPALINLADGRLPLAMHLTGICQAREIPKR